MIRVRVVIINEIIAGRLVGRPVFLSKSWNHGALARVK
jgi:hypothetical protein